MSKLTQTAVIAPLPNTNRGYPTHLRTRPSGGDTKPAQIGYGSGKNVWIREIVDPGNAFDFNEHNAEVTAVSFSTKGGGWIASGDVTGTYNVWTNRAKDPVCKLKDQKSGQYIRDMCWSPDMRKVLISGNGDKEKGKAVGWDSGNQFGYLSGFTENILACDYSKKRPFTVVAASEDSNVNFFHKSPLTINSSKQVHKRFANICRFSPDNEYVASAGTDKNINIFHAKSTDLLYQNEKSHKGTIYSLAWSPDSKALATVGADKTLRIWNFEADGEKVKLSPRHAIAMGTGELQDFQVGVAWECDMIISLSLGGDLSYVNPEDGRVTKCLSGHKKAIHDLAIAGGEDDRVYTSCSERVVTTSLKTGETRAYRGEMHGKNISLKFMALSCCNTKFYTAGKDDAVIETQVDATEIVGADKYKTGGSIKTLLTGKKSPGLVIVGSSKTGIHVLQDMKKVSVTSVDYNIEAMDLSDDETKLVVSGHKTGNETGIVFVYEIDVSSGALKLAYEHTTYRFREDCNVIKIHPDGERVFISHGKFAEVYKMGDMSKFCTKVTLSLHTGKVNTAFFLNEGKSLVIGTGSDRIFFLPAFMDNSHHTVHGETHYGGVSNAGLFSEKDMVTTGNDGSIKRHALEF